MRTATIFGNMGRDWESRAAGDSTAYSTSVAVREGKDKTLWIKCEAWGKQGEALQKYTSKGSQVCLSGDFTLETWEKDGKSNAQIKLRVSNFSLVSGPKQQEDSYTPATNVVAQQAVDDGIPF